jgi:hypothetical protein
MEIYTADYIENYGGEYYKADEVDAAIAELVGMLERVDTYERGMNASPLYKHELRALIAKYRGKRYESVSSV